MLNVDGLVNLITSKVVEVSYNGSRYTVVPIKTQPEQPYFCFWFFPSFWFKGGTLQSVLEKNKPIVPLIKQDQIKLRAALEYVTKQATVDVVGANAWVEIYTKELEEKVMKDGSK